MSAKWIKFLMGPWFTHCLIKYLVSRKYICDALDQMLMTQTLETEKLGFWFRNWAKSLNFPTFQIVNRFWDKNSWYKEVFLGDVSWDLSLHLLWHLEANKSHLISLLNRRFWILFASLIEWDLEQFTLVDTLLRTYFWLKLHISSTFNYSQITLLICNRTSLGQFRNTSWHLFTWNMYKFCWRGS